MDDITTEQVRAVRIMEDLTSATMSFAEVKAAAQGREEIPAAYIARDIHAGCHSVLRSKPKAASFTAAEIAAMAPTGILWESFGHPFPGREGFGRSRYVAAANGDLHIYGSDGAKVIIHPASRRIRVLTE